MTLPKPLVAALAACFALQACIVVPIPISTPTTTRVVGYKYPTARDPGPAPASSKCATPANAGAYAGQVIAKVNAERKARGLPAVKTSATLMKVAHSHACDNAARNIISHVGSDGSTLPDRLHRQGFQYRVAAENTGIGFADAETAMRFWMNSPGHRANILNPKVTEIGLGFVQGARNGWVMVLAARR